MSDAIRYTPGPDASQPAIESKSQGEEMPWVFKLIFLFLMFDCLERVYELILLATTDADTAFTSANPYGPTLPNLLIWVVVEPLLAVLLWLRTTWGRIWTQIIFAIHLFYIGRELAISSPELWVYLTETARLRLILTFLIDVAIIGYLFSGQSRRWLDR